MSRVWQPPEHPFAWFHWAVFTGQDVWKMTEAHWQAFKACPPLIEPAVLRWFRVDRGRNQKVSRVAVIGAVMAADSSLSGFVARERVVTAESSGARVVTHSATFEPRLVNEPEGT